MIMIEPEPIPLWSDPELKHLTLTPFLLDDGQKHGAVLVIPGGGYRVVCRDAEGEPIARTFNHRGFHAFVLNYSVYPRRFPMPQQDAMRAMRIIRHNAEEWLVIPDRIAACGFSAGGHLAGCLGTITDHIPSVENDAIDQERGSADALILGYAVLSFQEWSHTHTRYYLIGKDPEPGLAELCSLEKQVGPHTPPAMLWHTIGDHTVPFRNAVDFANAMAAHNRPVELHIFQHGEHGMLLGLGTPDVGRWNELAASFLEHEWALRDGDPEKVLERYDWSYQWAQEQKMLENEKYGPEYEVLFR